MSARQRAARQRRKMILFAVEIVIILIMAAVLYLDPGSRRWNFWRVLRI